jgi:hypothetical protein
MEKKALRELYGDVITEIYGLTEFVFIAARVLRIPMKNKK